MTVRSEFLDAWQQLDRAAERFSDARGRGATTATLKAVSERLVDAKREYGQEVGMSPVKLFDVLVAWRRAGFNHQRALTAFEAGWRERDTGVGGSLSVTATKDETADG